MDELAHEAELGISGQEVTNRAGCPVMRKQPQSSSVQADSRAKQGAGQCRVRTVLTLAVVDTPVVLRAVTLRPRGG